MINLLNAIITGGIFPTMTDEEAIESYIGTQDVRYFELVYNRYSDKVFAKCISMLNENGEAEDATQDIFMKVMLSVSRFKGGSKFSTWLYSITYNYCIDLIRKKKKTHIVEVDDFSKMEDTIEDTIEDKEILEVDIDRLQDILKNLNPDDKAVLMMKYLDDMSIKEMGDVLDKTESAIKMKIKRAKERFVLLHNQKYVNTGS